jgi:hypothetical protein
MKRNILINQVMVWSEEKKINASSKARIDVEKILQDKGFEIVEVRCKISNFPPLRAWNKKKAFMKSLVNINDGDNVWFQYPMYFSIFTFYLIANKLRKKNCNIFFVIHDIETIRYGKNIKQDIHFLNCADKIIAHTDNMIKILKEHGLKKNIEPMYLFPYLTNDEYDLEEEVIKRKDTVAFAGNLAKSEFIPSLLNMDFNYIKFSFYGLECNLKFNKEKRMEYMGKFSPNNVSAIKVGWGLVWDGNSIETCNGKVGEYLKYNSPHKLSLYVAAGIPVIVWKESAFKDFVEKNNIGIAVSCIKEIDERLANIPNEDYRLMIENTRKISKKLRKGGEFSNIVDRYIKENEE